MMSQSPPHVSAPRAPESPNAPHRRSRIARVLVGVLALNLFVAAAKLIYGASIGALSMTADGIHSLLDASSNVAALVGLWAARRPPDANHPYGHRKYETFAALGIVGMLLLACWQIGATAIEHLVHPHAPNITLQGFVVMFLTIGVNLVVVTIETREGRLQGSELLLADAAHTRSDVFASLLVLVSFVGVRVRVPYADVAAAIMIIGLILHAGFQILKGTLSTLGDERRIAPDSVEACALEEPGVREAHNVRSRGALDDIHLDLHILVDPATPLDKAHAIGHRVERRLRDRFIGLTDVVVHVEPALDSERAKAREGGGLRAED